MKIINRSDGKVSYQLPEMNNIKRIFEPWEEKEISGEELMALFSLDGGIDLVKQYLLVDDKQWVQEHFDAPIEYFWKKEEIRKCVFEDDLDLFEETFDYAPDGVIDLIKAIAWKEQLSDLNKIKIIEEKTGFDVMASIQIMSQTKAPTAAPATRRRREG